MNNNSGFTLLEFIIFIVVLGILAGSILAASSTTLKYTDVPQNMLLANELAASCAEWFIGQRTIGSFSSTNLPCGTQGQNYCYNQTLSAGFSGFSISETIDCSITNYKSITISVSGAGKTTLNLRLANY
jgi:Tfp pilus assembly protein PilE